MQSTQDFCKDSDLQWYRTKLGPHMYQFVLNTFRTFEGKEKKVYTKKDLENLMQMNPNYTET